MSLRQRGYTAVIYSLSLSQDCQIVQLRCLLCLHDTNTTILLSRNQEKGTFSWSILNYRGIYRVEVARIIYWKFIQLWGSISLCKETEITNWISISFSNQRGFLFSESLLWGRRTLNLVVSVGMVFRTLDNTEIGSPQWQLVRGWIPGTEEAIYGQDKCWHPDYSFS